MDVDLLEQTARLTRQDAAALGIARRVDGRWGFRGMQLRASTINEADRTVQATLTSENPVPMYDWTRGEVVPEVLLTEGGRFAKQIPLLDSHSRSSVANLLGSVRDIVKESVRTAGTLAFSETAADHFTKVVEGHLTDVSTGYIVEATSYVADGQTKTIRGKLFTGPVNVRTRWRGMEISLCLIGADELCKMRGLDPAALRSTDGDPVSAEAATLAIRAARHAITQLSEMLGTGIGTAMVLGIEAGRREMHRELQAEMDELRAAAGRRW